MVRTYSSWVRTWVCTMHDSPALGVSVVVCAGEVLSSRGAGGGASAGTGTCTGAGRIARRRRRPRRRARHGVLLCMIFKALPALAAKLVRARMASGLFMLA